MLEAGMSTVPVFQPQCECIIELHIVVNTIKVQALVHVFETLHPQVGPDDRRLPELEDADVAACDGAVVEGAGVHDQVWPLVHLDAAANNNSR